MGDDIHKRLPSRYVREKLHQHSDAVTLVWQPAGEQQTFHEFGLCGCHADLPREAAQGRKLQCETEICSTATIREEKFGLGLENKWEAALLLGMEVNTSLFKMHFFS